MFLRLHLGSLFIHSLQPGVQVCLPVQTNGSNQSLQAENPAQSFGAHLCVFVAFKCYRWNWSYIQRTWKHVISGFRMISFIKDKKTFTIKLLSYLGMSQIDLAEFRPSVLYTIVLIQSDWVFQHESFRSYNLIQVQNLSRPLLNDHFVYFESFRDGVVGRLGLSGWSSHLAFPTSCFYMLMYPW